MSDRNPWPGDGDARRPTESGTETAAPTAKRIPLELPPQPTETSCGPVCLHGLYRYHGVDLPLGQVVREVESLSGGGTLDVFLAHHALQRGFAATLITCNLLVFDPSWFPAPSDAIAAKLRASLPRRHKPKLRQAIQATIRYCEMGGDVRMEVLNGALIRRYLNRNLPILTGLSSTFLYGDARSNPATNRRDDLGGEAEGHFVLLTGYDREARTVQIADPYDRNPLANRSRYSVSMDRLINSILLGVLTYDANLLILRPRP